MSSSNNNLNERRLEPVKNTGQFVQHIAYWYDDGSIVVRVDDSTIYKIHLSMLMKLSDVMRSILSIPDNKALDDPTREGTSLYPLYLPGTNAEEFNDFLLWLYRAYVVLCGVTAYADWENSEWNSFSADPDRERIFAHLLKLSDMWDIKAGKTYAIAMLERMCLVPSRRLQLAGRFGIAHWVQPAVKTILEDRLTCLTENDLCCIAWKVYSLLVKAQEIQDAEIRRMAFVPPEMASDPSWECQSHTTCLSVWPKVWFIKVGRELLHPDVPMRLVDFASMVTKEDTLMHPRLSESCRRDMATQCANMTLPDEAIANGCAAAIVKFYNGLL
ncbi:hypothetical protein B0H19DRAFT_1082669 [Mycena capillaripes]|nr:hypothetical protein B0H19DRAFT_1082669 [Mycena capillaripes]